MSQENQPQNSKKKQALLWRSILEAGFIVFLFYSNLLMGEFEHSGLGQKNGLLWALWDIFTIQNLVISIIFAILGYWVFEIFRKRL
jgi:hypothetical protein